MRRLVLLVGLPLAALALRAAPGPDPIVLSWRARSEERVYGYLVYRSSHREGPYLRASADIIHVGPGAGEHSYEFSDPSIEPCTTYYYYLDQVYRSGQRDRFSGVVSKRTRCDEDD